MHDRLWGVSDARGRASGISIEHDGYVAVITLDRQDRLNALDAETSDRLRWVWRELDQRDDVHAVVLTGAGERAFCAGFDLKSVPDGFALDPPPIGGLTKGAEFFKPVLAAVNGLAYGGGFELVLACDLRYAAPEATFALPEPRLGLIPGGGGTVRLPYNLPWAIACDMILGDRVLSAEEAERYGLVNEVVPSARLLERVVAKAHAIAKLGPLALRAAKESMWRSRGMDPDAALRFEERLSYATQVSDEARSAVSAFAARPRTKELDDR